MLLRLIAYHPGYPCSGTSTGVQTAGNRCYTFIEHGTPRSLVLPCKVSGIVLRGAVRFRYIGLCIRENTHWLDY